MTDIDKRVVTAAHDYVCYSNEPICNADLIDAFRAGADFMSNLLRIRSPYRWGMKTLLLNMNPGQEIRLPYESDSKFGALKAQALYFAKFGYGKWNLSRDKESGDVIITKL